MYKNYYPVITAEEAAATIEDGQTIAFSGFTAAGAAKAVPLALARRGKEFSEKGKPFQVRVLSGASAGALDDNLAGSNVISWRAPYQSSKILRSQINQQQVRFIDLHLSHLPQMIQFGFMGKIDTAVVEAVEVTSDGRIYLSTSIGATPTFLTCAEKIIIEFNRYHSIRLNEMADIHILPTPPHRRPIPIYTPLGKVGLPYVTVDPKKIIGIVETDQPDGIDPLVEPAEVHRKIAEQVVNFLRQELKAGRIPKDFLPLQAGVGNIANAVMAVLGESPEIPPFYMYTEVLQDSLIDLMESGKLRGASATSLTISDQLLRKVYDNMDFFIPRIVLRPQELSNNPGVIRRLGVISLNTALEMDLTGHTNSTHVCGKDIVNGIGGSGDFTRNAYMSIFMCPSVTKGGRISTVVPMVTHADNTEHSVQVLVTEQGLADLRGVDSVERTKRIINNCAHPAYREYLWKYWQEAPVGHIRQDLSTCFNLHKNLMETGQMLPDLDLSQF